MSSSGGRWRGALEFSTLRRLTIYSPRHAGPVLLSQGFAQCNWQFVSILVGPEPSDRTIRLAKTSRRCGAGCDLLPSPTLLSEIAAGGMAQPLATTASGCDSTGAPRRAQVIVTQQDAALERPGYGFCNGFPGEVHRAGSGGIEVAVHPDERCAGVQFAGRRVFCLREAAVKMAGYEEPFFAGVVMGQAAVRGGHRRGVGLGRGQFRCLAK